jgi:Outer membrane protein beta-barrel domain
MKKLSTLFLSIILVGVANLAMGQVQFALGLKGGLNLSKIDINAGASNIDNRTGFHGGAFALFKLTKIGIQPEILFSKQGASYKVNTDNYEANFDYINVPIILKLYLAAGLNLQVGPQFGFLSTSELINTTTNVKDPQSAKNLFDKKSDLSVAIGAGWDLPFGLTLDARYNLGLADVQLKPSTTAPLDFKNKVIQVSLGYKFIKKGK